MANAARNTDGREVGSTPADGSPCSLHLDAVPESVYREYTPEAALKPYLVCAWSLEIPAGHGEHRQRVLPDGCSDILWIGDDAAAVVGPMTRSRLSSLAPGTTIVGLRFRPEAAASVFGVDADELVDRRVPLDQLWRRGAVEEASARVLEQPTADRRVDVAQSILASRRDAIAAPDPLVRHAAARLSSPQPDRVDSLADAVGVSERQLRRRFLAAVGYSPKLFQRILRFQRLLALAKIEQASCLGELALLAGYADQSHMTREVGEFAGVPPSALLGHVESALALSDLLSGDDYFFEDHTASS